MTVTPVTNDLIYDVGMNNGNDTAFYLACGYRVLAIEADPDLVAAASKRFKAEIDSKRLTILNIGIAEKAGPATFWINEVQSIHNSFERAYAAGRGEPHHPIVIQCRRVDEILREYGMPFYMKIDIEGHDIVCCNQLSTGNKPKYISVEMLRIELLLKLRDLGYDRFKLITQVDHQAIDARDIKLHVRALRSIYRLSNYRKENRSLSLRATRWGAARVLQLAGALGLWGIKPFKLRRMPEWDFGEANNCSGAFGEDLPGEWLAWDEVSYLWHRDLREYKKLGWDLWCDLHACVSTEITNIPTATPKKG